jgi:hypothetical protein
MKAVAKLAVVDLLQRAPDAADLDLALAIGGKRHLLVLHRIDSGQTPNTLLVELNGLAILSTRIPKFQQLIKHLFQAQPKSYAAWLIGTGHARHLYRWRLHAS